MENEDLPLVLMFVGGRRRLLSSPFHKDTPHHIFGPQIDGIVNVPVFVFVRIPGNSNLTLIFVSNCKEKNRKREKAIPAVDDGEFLDIITEFAID